MARRRPAASRRRVTVGVTTMTPQVSGSGGSVRNSVLVGKGEHLDVDDEFAGDVNVSDGGTLVIGGVVRGDMQVLYGGQAWISEGAIVRGGLYVREGGACDVFGTVAGPTVVAELGRLRLFGRLTGGLESAAGSVELRGGTVIHP
jgi:hypothetical protein